MPTTATAREIRADFDTISRLIPARDHLGPYERWLLGRLPARGGVALEIGCGVGVLARRLAGAFDRVVAVDFSESMIAEARRRTPSNERIEYVCTDMFEWLDAHPASYDCIVTVATLHHVDLQAALRSMSRSLETGGMLLAIDLLRRDWSSHPVLNAAAWGASLVREGLTFGRRGPWSLRRAYWRHGLKETYLSREEVDRIAATELPGAEVRGRLLWRYTVAWQKAPSSAPGD